MQRVAAALLRQIEHRRDDVAQIFPGGVRMAAPAWTRARVAGKPRMMRLLALVSEQIWEQVALPWRARGAVLLTLSNAAPIAAGRGITMIHDAQAFSAQSSYTGPFATWYRFLLPRLGRRNLRILTVSAFSAGELAAFGVAPLERITVIPNGVDHVLTFGRDPAILDRLGLGTPARGYVVALSSTQTHKNIAVLLRAFATIDPADMALVLVGNAGRVAFETLGLDVPASVIFAGKVSDGALRTLLEGAVCSATPSLTEGFGLPPLEGMLLGCPAVVAPCGALPEVCGDAALYADPHDPDAWRAAFSRLADDPELRARMIAQGRTQAGRFTWAEAGRILVDTLRTCA